MSETLIIGPQRKRELFFASQGGLILLLGIVRVTTGHRFQPNFSGILPLLMIAAGIVLLVVFLLRYRKATVGMEIGDRGLLVHRPPVGLIPWSHIAGVRTDRVRGRQFLHIALRDTVGLLSANPSASRWTSDSELWFDASGLDMDVSDIAQEIVSRRGSRS